MPESSIVDVDQPVRSRANALSSLEIPDFIPLNDVLLQEDPLKESRGASPEKKRKGLPEALQGYSDILDSELFFTCSHEEQQELRGKIRSCIVATLNLETSQNFIDKLDAASLWKLTEVCERAGLLTHSQVNPILQRRLISLQTENLTLREMSLVGELSSTLREYTLEGIRRGTLKSPKLRQKRQRKKKKPNHRLLESLRLPKFRKGPQSVKDILSILSKAADAVSSLSGPKFKAFSADDKRSLKSGICGHVVRAFTHQRSRAIMAKCSPAEALRLYSQILKTPAREDLQVGFLASKLVTRILLAKGVSAPKIMDRAKTLFFRANPVYRDTYPNGVNLGKNIFEAIKDGDIDSKIVCLQAGLFSNKQMSATAEMLFRAAIADSTKEGFDFKKMKQLVLLTKMHGLDHNFIYRAVTSALKKDASAYPPEAFRDLILIASGRVGKPVSHRVFDQFLPRAAQVEKPETAVSLVVAAARENYAKPEFYQPLLEVVDSNLQKLSGQRLGNFARALGNMGLLTPTLAFNITEEVLHKNSKAAGEQPKIYTYIDLLHGLESTALILDEEGNDSEAQSIRSSVEQVWRVVEARSWNCSEIAAIELAQFAKATDRKLPIKMHEQARVGVSKLAPGFVSGVENDVGRVLNTLLGDGSIKRRSTITKLQRGYRDFDSTTGLEVDYLFERKGQRVALLVNGLPHHYRNRDLGCGSIGRDYLIREVLKKSGIIPLEISDLEFRGTAVAMRVKLLARRIKQACEAAKEASTYDQKAA